MTDTTIFNVKYVYSESKTITCMEFWKNFAAARVKGFTDFVDYFEPIIDDYKLALNGCTEPEEERLANSLRTELERETGILNMMDGYRKTYQEMLTGLNVHEKFYFTVDNDIDLLSLETEILELEQDIKQLTIDQSALSKILEDQILYMEYPPKGTPYVTHPKKMAKQIDLRLDVYESGNQVYSDKVKQVLEISEQIIPHFKLTEREKLEEIVNIWRTALGQLDRRSKKAGRVLQNKTGAGYHLDYVKIEDIINKELKKREKPFRIENFKTVEEILKDKEDLIYGKYNCEESDTEDESDGEMTVRSQTSLETTSVNYQSHEVVVTTALQKTDSKKKQQKKEKKEDPALIFLEDKYNKLKQGYLNAIKRARTPDPGFKPYNTRVSYKYKARRDDELNIRRGNKVKVLGRPDEYGYVRIQKKSFFGKGKVGWVPQDRVYFKWELSRYWR